jgi:hypothetical protein
MVWKTFTILDCVNIVAAAAAAKEEVRKSTLNGSWRHIWPSVVLEKNQALPAIEDEYQRIINLAHSVGGEGFEDIAVEELRELTVESELNEADLIDFLTDANSNAGPVFHTYSIIFIQKSRRFNKGKQKCSPMLI